MSDLILDLVKVVAEKLGGQPGTAKWEVIAALFGWGAAFALSAWLLLAVLARIVCEPWGREVGRARF